MKIVFLNIYQNKVERGAENVVNKLSTHLQKNHQVDVIGGNATTLKRWPVLWRFYLDPSGLIIFWFTLKSFPKIFKEKYDIVIPVNGGWQSALLRILTWMYGGKMVISAHSGFGWDDRINLWSFPDRFVSFTKYGKKWSQQVNPFIKSRVTTIPNGVDLEKFKPKQKVRNKHFTVICVAAFAVQKRIDLAIKAVSKLDDVELIVVGKGSEKKKLQKLGHKLLKNRYTMFEANNRDMPKIYSKADVFVFPSKSQEAFGIVLLEALASGLPVVATDDPIRREIVGDAGFFVDPENTDNFAQAIKKALDTDWGSKPVDQAKKFSWDKVSQEYEKLFIEVLK